MARTALRLFKEVDETSRPMIGHLLSFSRYSQRLAFGITLRQPFLTLICLPSIESTRFWMFSRWPGYDSADAHSIAYGLWSRPMTE